MALDDCYVLIPSLCHFADENRFAAAVARAGLSPNYAENRPCGLPATSEQSVTGSTVVFPCDPPRVARYVTLDIDRGNPEAGDQSALMLAEVKVEMYERGECSDIEMNCYII